MKEVLKNAGLTDYEADIYLSLLENGQISAYDLAGKTGLYRQVTYDALNRLIEKGFVSSVKEGRASLYKAADPKIILEILNEKVDEYKNILPALDKLNNISKDSVSVETYRGKNILRIAFKDITNYLRKEGGEMLCTAVDEKLWNETDRITLRQYERDMLRYKFKERVLIKEGEKGMFPKKMTTYRKIPEKYFNVNPTQIYGNNVSIAIYGNPSHLIIIRNSGVADAYRKQFDLLWKIAKP